MAKDKKDAKMGHNKKKAPQEQAASDLVIITGAGHKVANTADTKAVCGEDRIGWRYGSAADVRCQFCKDGVRKEDALPEVPPTLPEGVDIDDDEAVLASLPKLDVEEFDKSQA